MTRCSVMVRCVGPALPGQRPDGDRWPTHVLLVPRLYVNLGLVAVIGVLCVSLVGHDPSACSRSRRRGFWPRQRSSRLRPAGGGDERRGVRRSYRRRCPAQARAPCSSSPWPSSASGAGLPGDNVDYSTTTSSSSRHSVTASGVTAGFLGRAARRWRRAALQAREPGLPGADLTWRRRAARPLLAGVAEVRTTDIRLQRRAADLPSSRSAPKGDPNDSSSLDIVPKLGDSVSLVAPGADLVHVGGGRRDPLRLQQGERSATRLIVLLALLDIMLILAALLPAIESADPRRSPRRPLFFGTSCPSMPFHPLRGG